ncbi:MAG TPA: recombinase family protein, partial [Candidatus Nanopelagicales bacterium]|nr:recombinase family protein [Candidatus Nanopelagicales bacterium]
MRPSGEMGRILRTLAYRRVSTREQGLAGTSLDAQKTEIQRYCAAHGLPEPVDHVEVESGGEESEEKRSEVMRLLSSVRSGDAVIVSKIDRFSRDMVFIVKHVRAIRKRGACFISVAEAFDSRRPESEMMLGAWAMAADMERRRIQERTQGPRKLLRAQGMYV